MFQCLIIAAGACVSLHSLSWNWSLPAGRSGYGQMGTVQWNSFLSRKCMFVKIKIVLEQYIPFCEFLGGYTACDSCWFPHASLAAGAGSPRGCRTRDPGAGLPWVGVWTRRVAPRWLRMGCAGSSRRTRSNLWNLQPSLGLSNLHWALEPLFYWPCLRFLQPETSPGMCFYFKNWKKVGVVCMWNISLLWETLKPQFCCEREEFLYF